MDNSGTLPPPQALSPRYRALVYGGLPSEIGSYGPEGDAPQVDVPNPVRPAQARGEGPSYHPHPYLPSAQHLDYFHKLTSTSLLTIGLVLLVVLVVRSPRTAGGLLARGGLRQAGVV